MRCVLGETVFAGQTGQGNPCGSRSSSAEAARGACACDLPQPTRLVTAEEGRANQNDDSWSKRMSTSQRRRTDNLITVPTVDQIVNVTDSDIARSAFELYEQ